MTHPADGVPEHLLAFLKKHDLHYEFMAAGTPMPTVLSAAAALGVPPDLITKSLLFVGDERTYVVALANGTNRIACGRRAQVAAILDPRPANPTDVIAVTGYPAGGVAPLGL